MSSSSRTNPFVSVIVPVRNAPENIRTCIEALLQQTYPQNCYEIIVVDNGSCDATRQAIQAYPVTMLVEGGVSSPYPARNRGIQHARGDVLAFTDSDCLPVAHWLECGVHALEQQSADLVGGKVMFTFAPRKTVGEMLDALYHLDMQTSINETRTCATANLFARRAVVDTIGLFPAGVRSGGDGIWTYRATRAGFKLVYAPEAQIYKPARRLLPVLKKAYRVGTGHPFLWALQERPPLPLARRMVRDLLPPNPAGIVRQIRRRGSADMLPALPVLWLLQWLRSGIKVLGQLHGLLRVWRST